MKTLPLHELSINEIYNVEKAIYEIPIYQRNYAWGQDEISALIQDVYDAYKANKSTYYIGTLVTFHKGDNIYEVIDGQQRLTTIYLLLKVLDVQCQNNLTYRARKKSDDTIKSFPFFNADQIDNGIKNGFEFAQALIKEIVQNDVVTFRDYFLNKVHIIHYQVPKDIDLNHYFEIMNSRGEQLEKHEIIKARLIEKLNDEDKAKFNHLWESCSEMSVYIQQKFSNQSFFGEPFNDFNINNFDELPSIENNFNSDSINNLLNSTISNQIRIEKEKLDSFQPIIDFSNFLLIVLKITRMDEVGFNPLSFTLDDKELIREFDKVDSLDEDFVKKFSYTLLKSKYFLDNYIIHHTNDEDQMDNNPWNLKYWRNITDKNEYLKNLDGESDYQFKLVHLLSMFEVAFTARQRKNYLFYILLFLTKSEKRSIESYFDFVSKLAEKYFKDVYLVREKLNINNTPSPGSFDEVFLVDNQLDVNIYNTNYIFNDIYGDGTENSRGIPLFIFNYIDYKIWEKYCDELRGEKTRENSEVRKEFFKTLGCSDLGLDLFDKFYFSRTRRSLEHYFPTALMYKDNNDLTEAQINCIGNYAMIGSAINSSGSNWSPKTKLNHYLDDSGKIKLVSVASLKFMIMMQKCRDNDRQRENEEQWIFQDIKEHQENILKILFSAK